MKNRKQHRYSSDQPITKFPEDKLGRGLFATRLANDITAWEGESSLVIGLFGGWGTGKTSLKNLVLAALKKKRSKMPLLEFNPWQLSGSGGISVAFFNELAIALGSKSVVEDQSATVAKNRLAKYSKRLGFGSIISRALGPLLVATGRTEEAAFVIATAEVLNQAAEASKAGSETIQQNQTSEDLPLCELKRSLDEALRKIKNPLLVVIDDIDRLTTHEILDVFQLVKVNADFPKVIYLLLFERSIVSAALDSVSNGRGNEFLEKIVQVGYHVPRASKESVQKVLFHGLDEILAEPGVSRRWDKNRWSHIYLDGLQLFFRNLRHVYRFLSSFDFHVRQFLSSGHFEVNPVDLIALETLRIFEPNVFERLAVLKTVLTRDTGNSLFGEIKQEAIEVTITDLISQASDSNRAAVRHIVSGVFPPIENSYAGKHGVSGEHRQQWLRDARVCHPNMFDRYFALAVDEGELAQTDIDRLIDDSGNCPKFVKRMKALQDRGLTKLAFEHLDAHKETIPKQNMASLVQALSDLSDSFPPTGTDMFETETKMMAARVIYFGLKREKDESKRLKILVDAFTNSTGILLPVFVTSLQERKKENSRQSNEYLVSEDDWAELRKLSLMKIKDAAEGSRLVGHNEASTLLWRWVDWAPDEAKSWIASVITNQKGVLWLLSVLMGELHSHGTEFKISYYIKLSNIERFGEIESLITQTEGVDLRGASEREQIAVREFKRALKRRDEGKPEFDGNDRSFNGDD